ncbi:MAG: 2-C-methyl-D-erythritol 2,4-cyclodiphosphate synthase [Candidatus Cloacimonadota bacterium]|nr:MAG: 2-C-methyl-D-erythritol 2,4-cyclodiphosphate synthase [Candidatus Cloacimonadota bacterium]PIE79936.1 MAG: 2-C-methyl-D-erythritol 2,4-cyclodiphosphate synthase [Candidatus Delongbacteria bacterium]
MFRIGNGYDVHKVCDNRKLILGGVEIPWNRGLLGHSDADVLLHAIMDGMLGALCLGDIGKHFPDTDEKYRGISSIKLLKEVNSLVKDKGYSIVNIDAVVMAEKPKLRPFIDLIRETISKELKIDVGCVSVKATTTEKLGFVGREEGIASSAVILLKREKNG